MPGITLKCQDMNEKYLPYLHDEHRVQIFFGGASSGKSVFMATRVVLAALSGRNVLVIRKVARTIRQSCWNEVNKAIGRLHAGAYFRVNKSEYTLESSCGAQILFCGLDDAEKIKSITPRRGILTDIWIEEATEIAREEFKQLDKRLRGASRFSKHIFLTFNPVWKTHWIYREFFGIFDEARGFGEDARTLIVKSTFRDNKFLTEEDRQALLDEKDEYFRRVYTDGEWGVSGDQVLTNWRVQEIPENAPGEIRLGLDFGFASDPCGAVMALYDRKRGTIAIVWELYEKGLTNQALAQKLRPIAEKYPVICDSAEPKSIEELRQAGIRALPAAKGPDSVLHGIQWLRGQTILVSPRCPNMQQELAQYTWARDKDGNSLCRPTDRDNHLLDALRYAMENDARQRFIRTGNID